MDFSIDLYREHLEEASFLYDQRGVLLKDPELTWPDLGDFEERFARHIEALSEGGETALQVCRQQAVEGDGGELHAAVRVFCRCRRLDLIREIFQNMDITDNDRVTAVANGLKHEWPSQWTGEIPSLWSMMPAPCLALLPRMIGFKRLATMDRVLLDALATATEPHRYWLVWALGRIKAKAAIPALLAMANETRTDIAAAVTLALLRMGEPTAAGPPADQCNPADFRQLLQLSLAGSAAHIRPLLTRLGDPADAGDPAFALGILGDMQAVEPLIQMLADPATAESAALGLNLITGAGLLQEVFVPEEIRPEELFEEELARWQKGEPLYPPGQAPGTTIITISQDHDAWHAWWRGNRSRFKPGVRYRNGQPFSPHQLLANLKEPRNPVFVRQIAYEELVVRYGIDVPFETDMAVAEQMQALEKLEAQIGQGRQRWQEGCWYFAGRVME